MINLFDYCNQSCMKLRRLCGGWNVSGLTSRDVKATWIIQEWRAKIEEERWRRKENLKIFNYFSIYIFELEHRNLRFQNAREGEKVFSQFIGERGEKMRRCSALAIPTSPRDLHTERSCLCVDPQWWELLLLTAIITTVMFNFLLSS